MAASSVGARVKSESAPAVSSSEKRGWNCVLQRLNTCSSESLIQCRPARHAAGVGKRSIEDRNPQAHRLFQVNLVGADAKAADCNQPLRVLQYFGGEMGASAHTDEVRIGNGRQQLVAGQ